MPNSTNLETAIKNEELRQSFLDQLIREPIPGCSGIFYDPKGTIVDDFVHRLMVKIGFTKEKARMDVEGMREFMAGDPYALVPTSPLLLGCVTDMPIFVIRGAFSGVISAEELRHCLVSHEGTHVRQMTDGFPCIDMQKYRGSFKERKLRPIVHTLLSELDAHYASGLSIRGFAVRKEWELEIRRKIKSEIAGLYNAYIASRCEEERGFIKAALDYFPHEPNLFRTGKIEEYL